MHFIQTWAKSKDLTPVRFEPPNFGSLVTHIFIGLFKSYTVTAMLLFQLEAFTTMAHMTPKIGIRVFPLKGSFTLSQQRKRKILSRCHCIVNTFTCCYETHFYHCRCHHNWVQNPFHNDAVTMWTPLIWSHAQPILDNKFPLSFQPHCERTFKLVDELIKFNDFPLETCWVITIIYVWSR